MSRGLHSSKYDLRTNPVYQIDWNHEASGKRVKSTKRRVRFRFGFSHRESIEQGKTGMDCRGEEHEVVLIWSLTSGKRLVVADGEEIHFSTGKFSDTMFTTSWQIQGGHMIKIIAYAAPPLVAKPGFRQFDLQIDGMSYFDMPKIFELGGGGNGGVAGGAGAITASRSRAVEVDNESYYSAAQSPSTSHFAFPASSSSRSAGYDMSDRAYMSTPEFSLPTPQAAATTPSATITPSPPPHVPTRDPVTRRSTMHELPPTVPSTPIPSAVQTYTPSPPPLQQVEWAQSAPVQDEFAPVPPPPPTYEDKSHQILSAYTPTSQAVPALANAPHFLEYGSASPGATISDVSEYDDSPTSTPYKPEVLKPTMEPLTIVEMEEKEMESFNEVDRAMKSLVNLNDLTHILETPEEVKMSRKLEEQKRNDSTKSNPLPPTAPEWHLGKQASLGDIQKHKKAPSSDAPKKEIMKTHAFDPSAAQAGMMVVYGATAPQLQQPPQPVHNGSAISGLPSPLNGFGAGVKLAQQQQQFYSHQQQAAMYSPQATQMAAAVTQLPPPPVYMAQ